jgi:hypothetical protein
MRAIRRIDDNDVSISSFFFPVAAVIAASATAAATDNPTRRLLPLLSPHPLIFFAVVWEPRESIVLMLNNRHPWYQIWYN